MEPRCDLHTHTLCSDGTLTPAELVARARRQGVTVLALTDHDTTDGLVEATRAAAVEDVTLIPGVEISVTWERQTIHVVGLQVDPADPVLQRGLAHLREARHTRAREIDRRLGGQRIHGAYEAVLRQARDVVSRTHFAHFLVEHGRAHTVGEAFKHYLSKGAPAYVPGEWVSLAEAVGWIRAAGGIAAIAHPERYKLSAGKLARLLAQFKECGGEAIEVISGSHPPEANRRFAAVACKHGLLASVGSDYHGPEKPWVDLGRLPPLPPECTPVWERWVGARDEIRGARGDAAYPCASVLVPPT